MSYVKKVAVVGATGTIGRHIVAALHQTGKFEVTAITRVDSSATIPAGVNVAKISYDDPSTIVTALRGQEVLVITLAHRAAPDAQEKLVDAAAEAGVSYVITNGWGVDVSFETNFLGNRHRAIEQRVEGLGKSAWMTVTSGYWYEFSLAGTTDRFGFDFGERKVIFFDEGRAKMNVVTFEQTGRAVAALLSLKKKPEPGDEEVGRAATLEKFENGNVYISSFLVSQKDMFDSVLRVTGTEEKDWTISYEKSADRYESGRELMKTGSVPGLVRTLYSRTFYPVGDGTYAAGAHEPKYGSHNDVLGLPKEDLDERTKAAIDRPEDFIATY